MRQEMDMCSIMYQPCDEESFRIGPSFSQGVFSGTNNQFGGDNGINNMPLDDDTGNTGVLQMNQQQTNQQQMNQQQLNQQMPTLQDDPTNNQMGMTSTTSPNMQQQQDVSTTTIAAETTSSTTSSAIESTSIKNIL